MYNWIALDIRFAGRVSRRSSHDEVQAWGKRLGGRAMVGQAPAGTFLEAGCTDAETAAITGQSRDMVEHYAKQVNQKRLAAAAILKWETADAVRAARKEEETKPEGAAFVQPAPEFVRPDPLERAKSWKYWSERGDLNSRPPVPQTGALTRLRYAPTQYQGLSHPRT